LFKIENHLSLRKGAKGGLVKVLFAISEVDLGDEILAFYSVCFISRLNLSLKYLPFNCYIGLGVVM